MRIYMQMPAVDDSLPRFYQLYLEPDLLDGWLLTKEWGHQGSPGRIKHEHYPDHATAEQALIVARDAQTKKGYRIVFVQGQTKPT